MPVAVNSEKLLRVMWFQGPISDWMVLEDNQQTDGEEDLIPAAIWMLITLLNEDSASKTS